MKTLKQILLGISVIMLFFLTLFFVNITKTYQRKENLRPLDEEYSRVNTDEKALCMQHVLIEDIERMKKKSCGRQVLRGEALPGSPLDLMKEIFLGERSRLCKELVLEEIMMARNDGTKRAKECEEPFLNWTKYFWVNISKDALDEIETQCETLLTKIRTAAMFEESCSPFMYGRGERLETTLSSELGVYGFYIYSNLKRQSTSIDRIEAEERKKVLDWLRFLQDMLRGGTSSYVWERAVEEMEWSCRYLEKSLQRDDTIGAESLGDLRRELVLLQESWPSIEELLLLDAIYDVYKVMRWDEEKSCWVASEGSGWRWEIAADFMEHLCKAKKDNGCLDDLAAYYFIYHYNVERNAYEKCSSNSGTDALFYDCLVRMDDSLERWKRWNERLTLPKAMLITASDMEDYDRKTLERGTIADILSDGEDGEENEKLVLAKYQKTRFKLQSLVVYTMYREEAERTGRSPAKDFFDSEKTREAMIDPGSKRKMKTRETKQGGFELTRDWFGGLDKLCEEPKTEIECP